MKAKTLRDMDDQELRRKCRDLQEEYFSLVRQAATENIENVALYGNNRKDIARIKTILRERELAREAGANGKQS